MTFSPIPKRPLDATAFAALRPAALFDLSGRVALVTGAGGEIGAWLAAGLGCAGATVLITDVDETRLEDTHSLLSSTGISSTAIVCDLSVPAELDKLVEASIKAEGRIDVLVNCAALNRRAPMLDVSIEDYELVMAIDLRAPYFLSRSVARVMTHAGHGGSIINIGSINVAIGLQDVSVYGQAKAALSQLTKVMAVEWSERGIRANCLCPGFMLTALLSRFGLAASAALGCCNAYRCADRDLLPNLLGSARFWHRRPAPISTVRRSTSTAACWPAVRGGWLSPATRLLTPGEPGLRAAPTP